jgi:hypothetical protein
LLQSAGPCQVPQQASIALQQPAEICAAAHTWQC